MENTPKLQRKSSLSLSTRINNKRHTSPQPIKRTAASNSALNSHDSNNIRGEVTRSPSIISISSDGGIECCTPPPKRMGMCVDDCGDYSPKLFDSSFSPSCLLSQTLAIDSPEVGWKWSRYSAGSKEELSSRTPDSAYAADSSFTSAGSSSTEISNARNRERLAYDAMREQQMRKVEKTRADQKLKQRCAKLQEQLKSAGTQKSTSSLSSSGLEKSETVTSSSSSTVTAAMSVDVEMSSTQATSSTLKMESPMDISFGTGESIDDFFNDSDEDCFLLAATQEIESKMNGDNVKTNNNNTVTPKASTNPVAKMNEKPASSVKNYEKPSSTKNTDKPSSFPSSRISDKPSSSSSSKATDKPSSTSYSKATDKPSSSKPTDKPSTSSSSSTSTATTSTTTSDLDDTFFTSCGSVSKEKRSSFYMKFLEDDCPDDWFVSLDEIIEKATQSKKPRTSFQRYKSLPMNNNTEIENQSTIPKVIAYSDPVLNGDTVKKDAFVETPSKTSTSALASSSSTARSKIKRHSSSHALSPSNTNYRRRQHQ
ncbi:uncharacterized protein DDB_G0271670 [Musca vetustissima]|uniref:uncharacterized protein DDB_G0271670 n=1 Tax=Musca vetustissima TaxID=27455 RepID=UPI002AB69D57|nr:uncharacterized protein DDB_G0271670 [Musca vetustissima]